VVFDSPWALLIHSAWIGFGVSMAWHYLIFFLWGYIRSLVADYLKP
jgi:hypothetical protein